MLWIMLLTCKQKIIPDKTEVRNICEKLNLSEPTAALLVQRGINTPQKALEFLYPDDMPRIDPFSIDGISECVERLKIAIEKNERVVVYGDFDCDGICSVAMLVSFLRHTNKNVFYYIPDRFKDGYGIKKDILMSLIDDYNPDLFISVDCGITAVDEVAYLKSQGIDCIITDHHEPQNTIPDCIVVDPKIHKKGFYDYCGAGIVIKIIHAVAGVDVAFNYSEMAAIATLADVVPLIGENRLIVRRGLNRMNSENAGLATKIFKKINNIQNYTCREVSFKVAPKINAAGRVGNAMKTLDLFLSKDADKIQQLILDINEDNRIRQERCEGLTAEVLEKLKSYDIIGNKIIMLYGKNWDTGILGIVAARISEKFHRPVILLSENEEGVLKGSARSICDINIFELLNAFSDKMINFGGHSSAAGLTFKKDYYNEILKGISEILTNNVLETEYLPTGVNYDVELKEDDINPKLIKEMKLLEPFGIGNPTPIFKFVANNHLAFKKLPNSEHIVCRLKNFEIIGFGLRKCFDSYTSNTDLIISLNENEYRGHKTVQGVIRAMVVEDIVEEHEDRKQLLLLSHLLYRNLQLSVKTYSYNDDFKPYHMCFGTLFIAFNRKTYEDFVEKHKADSDFFFVRNIRWTISYKPLNRIIYLPDNNFPLQYYNQIVFLDKPYCDGYIQAVYNKSKAQIFIADNAKLPDCKYAFDNLPTVEELRELYSEFKQFCSVNHAINIRDMYQKMENYIKYDFYKTALAFYMFVETGLLKIDDGFNLKFVKLDKPIDITQHEAYKSYSSLKNILKVNGTK